MKKRILVVALFIVIGGSALSLLLRLTHSPASFDNQLLTGLGAGTAEETARLLGGRGRVVEVIGSGTSAHTLQAFHKGLKRAGDLTVIATVQLSSPDADLGPLLETHATADALVVFHGGRVPATVPRRPALVLVEPVGQDLFELLRAGTVALAIYQHLPPKPGTPQTDREWFDAYYRVLTPTTVPDLAPE